jgi:hypothetical protein
LAVGFGVLDENVCEKVVPLLKVNVVPVVVTP